MSSNLGPLQDTREFFNNFYKIEYTFDLHFGIVELVFEISGQPLTNRSADGTVNSVLDLSWR